MHRVPPGARMSLGNQIMGKSWRLEYEVSVLEQVGTAARQLTSRWITGDSGLLESESESNILSLCIRNWWFEHFDLSHTPLGALAFIPRHPGLWNTTPNPNARGFNRPGNPAFCSSPHGGSARDLTNWVPTNAHWTPSTPAVTAHHHAAARYAHLPSPLYG